MMGTSTSSVNRSVSERASKNNGNVQRAAWYQTLPTLSFERTLTATNMHCQPLYRRSLHTRCVVDSCSISHLTDRHCTLTVLPANILPGTVPSVTAHSLYSRHLYHQSCCSQSLHTHCIVGICCHQLLDRGSRHACSTLSHCNVHLLCSQPLSVDWQSVTVTSLPLRTCAVRNCTAGHPVFSHCALTVQ